MSLDRKSQTMNDINRIAIKMQANGIGRITVLAIIWIITMIWLGTVQAWSQTLPIVSASDVILTSMPVNTNIWQGEVGEGFRPSVQTMNLEVGAAAGFQAFGGEQNDNLALISLSYGHRLGDVVGDDHWYRGNWEVRGELFSGAQFSPSTESLVGLTPHLRYNLATGTRWIPFADLGAGVSATSIGPPDLSGTFEFYLQANTGVNWFVRDNIALTFEAGYDPCRVPAHFSRQRRAELDAVETDR
ncbi:MAG: acyloxyacyl hydrolase [Verrucomicrobiia bacterium]